PHLGDQQSRANQHLAVVFRRLHQYVRDVVHRPRGRHLRVVRGVEQPVHPLVALLGVVVDERGAGLGVRALLDGHPVHAVGREQVEPRLERALVEQPRLAVQESLGLLLAELGNRGQLRGSRLISRAHSRYIARWGFSSEISPRLPPPGSASSRSIPRLRTIHSIFSACIPLWLAANISMSSVPIMPVVPSRHCTSRRRSLLTWSGTPSSQVTYE